jgi:uncharacterized protein (TIGR03435 family)
MIRSIFAVCVLSCAIAPAQSFVASAAKANSDPGLARVNALAGTSASFDAVSIKPATARDQQSNVVYAYPGGRIFCAHCDLQYLASLAFNLHDWQITGGSDWTTLASETKYDIDATGPEGSQSSSNSTPLSDQQRQMLKSMLIDRFGLQGHRQTTPDTVYILQRGDQPLRLVPPLHPNESHWAGGTAGGPIGPATGLAGKNISMPELATRLSNVLRRPVVDRTGLSGNFDFQCRPDDPTAADLTGAVFSSLRAIGLNLAPANGTVEFLVIDHIQHPTEN